MTTTESETVLSRITNDTWSTPDQSRINNFIANIALKHLDNELAEVEL